MCLAIFKICTNMPTFSMLMAFSAVAAAPVLGMAPVMSAFMAMDTSNTPARTEKAFRVEEDVSTDSNREERSIERSNESLDKGVSTHQNPR